MINDLSFLLRLFALTLIGPVLGGMGVAYQLQICRLSVLKPQFVLVLCLVLPVFLLTALLHELGHAIAAMWANLRVTQFSLFGLSLYQADSPNPWRLRVAPGGALGSSVVAIAQDGTALRRRHIIYILGGVMMGFFVAALCLGARPGKWTFEGFSSPGTVIRARGSRSSSTRSRGPVSRLGAASSVSLPVGFTACRRNCSAGTIPGGHRRRNAASPCWAGSLRPCTAAGA
jgi:hypothetical protein